MTSLQDFIIKESEWAYDKCNGFAILKPEFLDHEDEWIHMLTDQGWTIENHLKFQRLVHRLNRQSPIFHHSIFVQVHDL